MSATDHAEGRSTKLEIAHALFMDIVGYSRLPLDHQKEVLGTLQAVVSGTPDDEVTRTEPVGWTGKTTRELRRLPEKQRGCTTVGVCAKKRKRKLNTLDEADFVRDVEKSASHHQSRNEIASDNPCGC
jgi:hypothetical protein